MSPEGVDRYLRRWKLALGIVLTSSLLLASTVWAAPHRPSHVRSTVVELTSLHMTSKATGWATDGRLSSPTALFGGQILHTVDGARRWTNVTPTHVTFNEQSGSVILPHDSITDFLSGSVAIVATQTALTSTGASKILLSATTDGGHLWQQRSVRLATSYELVTAVDFVNRWDGWLEFQPTPTPTTAPIGAELWRTTDGGRHWARVYQTTKDLASLVGFDNSRVGWLAVQKPPVLVLSDAGTTLDRTINGGVTWRPASAPLIADVNLAGIPPTFDGLRGVLLVTMGVFATLHTDDAGKQWDTLSPSPIAVPANWTAEDMEGRIIWILTSMKLWRSTNGGHSWTVQSGAAFLRPQSTKNGTYLKHLDFTTAKLGWIWNDGPGRRHTTIWETVDGGRRWTTWTARVLE